MQDQEEEVKFSKTERGAEVLIYKGFDYVERKERRTLEGKKSWRCRDHKKHKCSASMYTQGDVVIQEVGWSMHSHTGDPLLPKKRQVQALLRERASVSMETTSSVVSSALQGASADILQRLP